LVVSCFNNIIDRTPKYLWLQLLGEHETPLEVYESWASHHLLEALQSRIVQASEHTEVAKYQE
jgi:hypothetical protein